MSLVDLVQEAQAGARERRIRELEGRLRRARARLLQWSTTHEECCATCPNSRHLSEVMNIVTEEG